jgi:hypothetical protein
MNATPSQAADVDPVIFLILVGSLSPTTIALAIRRSVHERDAVPLTMCLAALACQGLRRPSASPGPPGEPTNRHA